MKYNLGVHKRNNGKWAFQHQCSSNREHVQGPFATEQEAQAEYDKHTRTCQG
jgi:hypothetical protein